MKRRTLILSMSLLVVFLLLAGTVSYAKVHDKDPVQSYTVEEAINEALDDNPNIEIAENQVNEAVSAAAAARTMADTIPDTVYDTDRGYVQNDKIADKYGWEVKAYLADGQLSIARKSLEITKDRVRANIMESYYSALKNQHQVEVSNNRVKLAEEQLRLAQKRYEVGVAPRKDILDAEVQLVQAQAKLSIDTRNLKMAKFSLKTDMGLPSYVELILTDDFKYEPIQVDDLDHAAQVAADRDISIVSDDEMLEVYNKAKDRGEDIGATGSKDYSDVLFGINEFKAKKELHRRQLDTLIYGVYVKLKAAEEQIKTMQKQLEQAKESLRLTQLRYQAGMATTLEVNSASNLVTEVETNLNAAMYDYMVSRYRIERNLYTDAAGY